MLLLRLLLNRQRQQQQRLRQRQQENDLNSQSGRTLYDFLLSLTLEEATLTYTQQQLMLTPQIAVYIDHSGPGLSMLHPVDRDSSSNYTRKISLRKGGLLRITLNGHLMQSLLFLRTGGCTFPLPSFSSDNQLFPQPRARSLSNKTAFFAPTSYRTTSLHTHTRIH